MKKIKIVSAIIAAVIFLWAAMGFVDYGRAATGNYPVFCINNDGYYQGLGYSFDMYSHPVTGKVEYCFYLFGCQVKSTFTN